MALYLHPPALPVVQEEYLDYLAYRAPVGTIVLLTISGGTEKTKRITLARREDGNWCDLETTSGWKPEDGKDFGYGPDNVFKPVEGEERAVQLVYLPEN